MLVIDPDRPAYTKVVDFSDQDLKSLRTFLTYHDKSAEFQYRKFRHARWYLNKYGEEAFQEELASKKAAIQKCLVEQNPETGEITVYTGLVGQILQRFPDQKVINNVSYPEGASLPWKNKPHVMRDYQVEATEKLLEVRHGAVEIATGLGKSRIIIELVRRLGLKTVIMAPLGSIADQLYRELVLLLGEKYVGFYGDGKKNYNKLITVGIHASLTRIEPNTPAWDSLSKAKVFINDEAHLSPATSLEKVCMGVCSSAPYRFFFSATQIRSDGLEPVLKGITGPIVHHMTFGEGVDRGFLSKPHFKVIPVPSNSYFHSDDANEMTRHHLYYNPEVYKKVGHIVDAAIGRMGHQVLILVQEMEQFARLLPYLRHPVSFAHGGVTKDNKEKIPKEFHESDPVDLVGRFNAGQIRLLVGTSCVATGTDFRPVNTLIYLMGQSSEIKVKQAVGRGTRTTDTKKEFYFFDFLPVLAADTDGDRASPPHRHAQERIEYYRELYDSVEIL